MNTYLSGAPDMRAFAESRVRETAQTLAVHRADGSGRCARCDRRAPCDDVLAAARVGQHYREWLDSARLWIDPGHAAARVRPYVFEEGGRQ